MLIVSSADSLIYRVLFESKYSTVSGNRDPVKMSLAHAKSVSLRSSALVI
jgi:hypothetical protein